ncbi:MAG: thiamine phosphate synthase [Alphaproteobacteria bacterium]|nr:thiamine phosphate synthase [Alphaproteobacteria bacterium]
MSRSRNNAKPNAPESDAPHQCRLYLVTPPQFELEKFAGDLNAAFDGGDVAVVQLRLKDASDDAVKRAIERLMPIAHRYDVAFLVNDRPDIAAEMGCDGAHIGQDDMKYAAARAVLGPDKIIGVTCHDSRHLAIEAAEQGADYVAFGAFYPTTAKIAKGKPAPDLLTWWSQFMTVPVVAIGGIFPHNVAPLVQAGADFVAVISAVFYAESGPATAVKSLNAAIVDAKQSFNDDL